MITMRSNELVSFQKKISELNKHYSHFLFISEQFIIDHQSLFENKPELYTSEVEIFNKNRFSKQFNSKLKELIGETEETKSFILRSLFLLSYFQFEVYLREIYNFARKYIASLPELGKTSILNQVKQNLELKKINELELVTLDYINLRRNALVHRDPSRACQKTIANFIKTNGKKLNKYWKSSSLEIKSLDFTKKEIENFDSLEVIDILNILRRSAEQVDSFVLSEIGQDNLIKYLIEEFEKEYNKPIKSWSDQKKLVKKFKHFARIFLGAIMEDKKIVKLLEK